MTNDNDFDICWCKHTRIQHGLMSPELCNFCTDCTGFQYDMTANVEKIVHQSIQYEHYDKVVNIIYYTIMGAAIGGVVALALFG